MHDVFEQRNIQKTLRNAQKLTFSSDQFQLKSVKTSNGGLRALKYLSPKIWSIVAFEIKN